MTTVNRRSAARSRERLRRLILAGVVSLAAASCAHQPAPFEATATASRAADDTRVAACRDALAAARGEPDRGLDAGNIRLFNWNVQKRRDPDWRRDFDRLTDDVDLVLMQEASLGNRADNTFAAGRHWSFAPGYRTAGTVTGVLTLSRSEPLVRCSFVSREPWLRTPKATSITAYRLAGAAQTLAVVNIHAVNFSLGLADYEAQFARVLGVLRDHRGPIILAGDFNTWRGRRLDIVNSLTRELQLQPVTFDDDERLRFFGFALDHIYVRDLDLRHADTEVVLTSDHNPMTAVLGVPIASP